MEETVILQEPKFETLSQYLLCCKRAGGLGPPTVCGWPPKAAVGAAQRGSVATQHAPHPPQTYPGPVSKQYIHQLPTLPPSQTQTSTQRVFLEHSAVSPTISQDLRKGWYAFFVSFKSSVSCQGVRGSQHSLWRWSLAFSHSFFHCLNRCI